MMLLFIVAHLLLRALLLQSVEDDEDLVTHTTQRTDASERFGEFCLYLPDDSEWTSSTPDTPVSTQSVTPTKLYVLRGINPELFAPLDVESDLPPEQTTSPIIGDTVALLGLHGKDKGCQCNKENMKKPTDTSRVLSFTKRYPTDTCGSTEYIETLVGGTEVCVSPFNFLEWLHVFLTAPTTPPPTTRRPLPTEASYIELNIDSDLMIGEPCDSCTPVNNMDGVDLMAVKSLDMELVKYCPHRVQITMKNDAVFCLDLSDSSTLKVLEVLLNHEDDGTPKNSACSCHKKTPESLIFTRLTISIPAMCLPAQFVEAVMDGEELCMPVTMLLALLENIENTPIPGLNHIIHLSSQDSPRIAVVECVGCYRTTTELRLLKDARFLKISIPSPGCPVLIFFTLADYTSDCIDSRHPLFMDLMEMLKSAEDETSNERRDVVN